MLYGMAEPVHAALRSMGQRLRVYAPVGELVPGMAYLVRRLLENTSNESFLRHRFAEGKELRDLVRPPKVKDRDLPDALPEAPVRPPTDPSNPGPFDNEPPAELRRITPRARLVAAVGATPGQARVRGAGADRREARPHPGRDRLGRPRRLRHGRVPQRPGRFGRGRGRGQRRLGGRAGMALAGVSPDGPPCCSRPRHSCGPGKRNSRR